VCLRCLEREPRRRYASAADLADDLHRFCEGQPVRARPVSAAGRLWRWGRRRPGVAALLSLLAVVVLTALVSVTLLWQQAEAERSAAMKAKGEAEENQAAALKAKGEAEESRADALAKFALAREAADNYATRLLEDVKLRQEDLRPLRRDLLKTVVPIYEKLAQGHSGDAAVEADRGRAYLRLGKIMAEIESQRQAAELLQKAVGIFDELRMSHPDDVAYQEGLAESLRWLGDAY
jgi:hypothetical protein